MSAAPTTNRAVSWRQAAFACAVFFTALASIRSNTPDPDLWGHVQFGREVIESKTLPTRTTWSFTSHGRWVNHENIAELALATAADQFGVAGLLTLKFGLTSIILGLMIGMARRRGVGWWAIAAVLVLAAKTMQFHWHFRPHIFGYAIFAALVALLDWCFENWQGERRSWREMISGAPVDRPDAAVARLRWLWFGAPLLALWTNTHGGYAAGLAIWIAYLCLRGVEAWAWWGRAALPLIRRLAMMVVAGGLATCFNPYGPQLHLWLAEDVWLPRPEIRDWHPLWSLGSDAWPVWTLLVLGGIAIWKSPRRRDLTQIVILSLVLWQSLSHCRHVLFLAILCGFWLPAHIDSLWIRLRSLFHEEALTPARIASERSATGSLACASGWCAAAWSIAMLAVSWTSLTSIPVAATQYPVAAMQFLRDHQLYGRTVVSFNWAQYAIACFAADPAAESQARVAIDGRLRTCYSQETIDVYLDFFLGATPASGRYRSPRSQPCDPTTALTFKSPELLVIETRNVVTQKAIEAHQRDWRLVYEDELAQVWLRRDLCDQAGDRFFVQSENPTRRTAEATPIAWPATPNCLISAERIAERSE
jgi:hypothetical protein